MSVNRLRIAHANGRVEEREFGLGRFVIGRERGDIVLGDENVSARHAELLVQSGSVVITDLGSRNGTFGPTGQRLSSPHALAVNQPVRLGASTFTLLPAPAPAVAPARATGLSALADAERNRRRLGLALFWIGTLLGTLILFRELIVRPLLAGDMNALVGIFAGALIAFPAGLFYLTVPRLLDRYDPEPWYALLGCLAWGGLAATGFSLIMNSAVSELARELAGPLAGAIAGPVLAAPLVEEFWKALGVFGVFLFLRREFDGVIDGIMYATFTAIGFATVENVVYYCRAAQHGQNVLAEMIVQRGILSPWCHPFFTSMLGIGVGLARETAHERVRWAAPVVGFLVAVSLHALWNGNATFDGHASVLAALPLWLAFVLGFFVMVIGLVVRRSRVIARFLEDEIHMGNLTLQEVRLVCHPFGITLARLRHGKVGVEFIRSAARLGLSKWHFARAASASKLTLSADFIVPLRQELAQYRSQMTR